MRTFLQDILLTLLLKGILLYVLWFCCVKGHPSAWHNSSDWMLGHSFQSSASSIYSSSKFIKGVNDDTPNSR